MESYISLNISLQLIYKKYQHKKNKITNTNMRKTIEENSLEKIHSNIS